MKKIIITCRGADSLPLDSLENFQGNLKKLSKSNLDKLKKQIIRNGFNVPFFVWRVEDWCRILDGHQRLKALLSLREDGYEIPLLPVAYIEAENEKDARQKLLGIASQYGEFEIEQLGEWIDELDADIAESLRFSDGEIKIELDELEEKTEIPEEKKEPEFLKVGDLLELNNHRVLCGDSTKKENIDMLMNGLRADMIFTDPPYEISIDPIFINNFIDIGNIFIFQNDRETVLYLLKSNFKFVKFFIFYHGGVAIPQEGGKESFLRHILISHEKKGNSLKLQTREGLSSVIKSKYRHEKETHKHLKPLDSLIPIIKGYSKEKDIVLDFFAGSGSILIASEKLNRKCFCVEIDPCCCETTFLRYYNFCLDNNITMDFKLNGTEYKYKKAE
ncbi:MAG TPA: DNA methyltransferase [Candidatus Paceibacterota bacterium]|nr:DNA methyltransferase [Candidatus Paceibacterota bacterium]